MMNYNFKRKRGLYRMYATDRILEEVVDVKSRALEFFGNIYNQEELSRACEKLKFFSINKNINVENEEIASLIIEAKKINSHFYTQKSWKQLKNEIEIAEGVKNQKNIKKYELLEIKKNLRNSIDILVEVKGKRELRDIIIKAQEVQNIDIAKKREHMDAKVENFICAREYARIILMDMNVTEHFVEVASSLLKNSINELFLEKQN